MNERVITLSNRGGAAYRVNGRKALLESLRAHP